MKYFKILILIITIITITSCSPTKEENNNSNVSSNNNNLNSNWSIVEINKDYYNFENNTQAYLMILNDTNNTIENNYIDLKNEQQNFNISKWQYNRSKDLLTMKKYLLKSQSTIRKDINQTEYFYVINDFSINSYSYIKAELMYNGKNCLIYIDENMYIDNININLSENIINNIGQAFDNIIYPTLTKQLGLPPQPGIDNEEKIYILITDEWDKKYPNIGGYFDSLDEYNLPFSNRKELIKMNVRYLVRKTYNNFIVAKSILAHEFQHMINFNQKTIKHNIVEDIWINEGLSKLAEQLCGFSIKEGNISNTLIVKDYLDNIEKESLTQFNSNYIDYASAYLFLLYIKEHYNLSSIKNIEQSNLTGISNIEYATKQDFNELFKNFSIANLLDNEAKDPLYNYSYLNLNSGVYNDVQLNGVHKLNQFSNFSLKPYTTRYYILPQGNFTIDKTKLNKNLKIFLIYKN